MGLRSQNNPIASFRDVFSATGKDAVSPPGGPSAPLGLTASGGVISDYIEPGPGNVYRAHIFRSSGEFDVTELSSQYPNTIEYLLVAGGGGTARGSDGREGGSGAGGMLTGTSPVSVSPYTISIGAGGAGGLPISNNGGDTTAFSLTAVGGGGGGVNDPSPNCDGRNGGSGGGGWYVQNGIGGNGTAGQGNNGSPGFNTPEYGGGGGGAGGAGNRRTGGAGLANDYAYGSSNPVTYAAGGEANNFPGIYRNNAGAPATGNGGSGYAPGGSGIAVVRYQIGQLTATRKATGGAISYYGGKTIHTFTSSGTFATESNWTATNVEYVVIGGGGSGGSTYHAGGGGAGGYLDGTTPIGTHPVSVSIQVGGGAAAPARGPNAPGTQGTPSYFGTPITATGGGGGGSTVGSAGPGGSGGSGGGGSGFSGNPGAGTGGQGYAGGTGGPGPWSSSAGGGGAGGVGSNGSGPHPDGGSGPGAPATAAGMGGLGRQIPSTFRDPASRVGAPGPTGAVPSTNPGGDTSGLYWVAGGGGGNSGSYGGPGGGRPFPWTDSPIADSSYAGGGAGNKAAAAAGTTNTGGGGGGSERNRPVSDSTYAGGAGGSGIVIIAYPTF